MAWIKLPRNVTTRKNADGSLRFYHRKTITTADGKRRQILTRLPDIVDPKFQLEYDAASGAPAADESGSVRQLVEAFKGSQRWAEFSAETRISYERSFRRLIADFGAAAVINITMRDLIQHLDTMADTPAQANRCLSNYRVLWRWAIPREYAVADPTTHIERRRERQRGNPWPLEAIRQAVRDMRGDVADVIALLFYTAQRKGDVLALAPEHMEGEGAWFVQEKTKHHGPTRTYIHFHPEAMEIIRRRWPDDGGPFLRTSRGGVWSKKGFNSSFDKEMRRIGLAEHQPRLVIHGLRHSAAHEVGARAGDRADALVPQLLGHADAATSKRYTKELRQRRDATDAVSLLPSLRGDGE